MNTSDQESFLHAVANIQLVFLKDGSNIEAQKTKFTKEECVCSERRWTWTWFLTSYEPDFLQRSGAEHAWKGGRHPPPSKHLHSLCRYLLLEFDHLNYHQENSLAIRELLSIFAVFLLFTLPTKQCAESRRLAGHRSYLVGGSVRDLLVKQTPKDFDILTTAEPMQVSCSAVH